MKATREQLDIEAARVAARNAIKEGVLIPTPCVRCLDPKKKVVAHHDNYAKPLDVMFLCEMCHKVRHRELGWGFLPEAVKRSRGTNVSINGALVDWARTYFKTTPYKSLSGFVTAKLREELPEELFAK